MKKLLKSIKLAFFNFLKGVIDKVNAYLEKKLAEVVDSASDEIEELIEEVKKEDN